MNADPTKALISSRKIEIAATRRAFFATSNKRMLIPQSPMAVQPSFGRNFQQDSSSSVPRKYGVSNQMLYYDHTTRNTYENLFIDLLYLYCRIESGQRISENT